MSEQDKGNGAAAEAQFDDSMFVMDESAWLAAGSTPEGKVGFKIESAKLGTRKTVKQPIRTWPVVELEVSIVARPEGAVTPPKKFFDNISVDPTSRDFKRFKSLVAAAGISPRPGTKLDTREVIKALPGRPAFGTVEHREYEKNGVKETAEQFGRKFGRSFAELG